MKHQMSMSQNAIRQKDFPVSEALNRLLLFCRFDLRQKSWGLPTPGIRSGDGSLSRVDSNALASLISKNVPKFSDPSLGGANPSKRAGRRIRIRRSLKETKTTGGNLGRRTKNPNMKFSFRNPLRFDRAESISN
jgi:hypothetical protein